MAYSTALYDDMRLYNLSDFFYIVPAEDPREVLVINKDTGKSYVSDFKEFVYPQTSFTPVCGILGAIKLLSGKYLIVATHRIHVGIINDQDIYQLAGFDILPYSNAAAILSVDQMKDEKRYLKMLKSVMETPYLYFSYDYDITHCMQRLYNTPPEFIRMSMAKRSDPRFLWNIHLLKEFNDDQFQKFALPLMHGFICINHCTVNGKIFMWSLISRRSIFRAGTRLFTRGIDEQGSVANFVETEQIVEFNGSRSSFVQTRGSIPLFWSQLPNLKYKPRPRLHLDEDHLKACRLHFIDHTRIYGQTVLINLVGYILAIDQTGSEEVLENEYKNAVVQLNDPSIRYESFDFHSECRNLKWHRVQILIDRLAHEQDEFSYFLLSRNGMLISQQTGIFRTNCVDCLDRTNVVQSLLARRSLDSVLRRMEILRPTNETIKDHDNLEYMFKMVWADNADFISMQYSGTGALKTDFTRTGKRTKLGLFFDGCNSLRRYYMNNFTDGFRQDSIDLFLGNYEVKSGDFVRSPFKKDMDWKYIAFPSVLSVAIIMFFASVVFPAEYSTEVLLYLMFWGAMIGFTLAVIFRYGKEFVDYPRLKDLNGPPVHYIQPEKGFPF